MQFLKLFIPVICTGRLTTISPGLCHYIACIGTIPNQKIELGRAVSVGFEEKTKLAHLVAGLLCSPKAIGLFSKGQIY